MLQHIMLIKCVLVLKYSQSTVLHYLHQLLWGGMADVTKNKKWKMMKVKLQFFVWKKETPPHVFTTRLRHRITPWGESERPRGRTTGKYVKNILLAYFSLRLWHCIFSHILDVRKKTWICFVSDGETSSEEMEKGIFWDLTLVAPWYPAGKAAEWKFPFQMKWRMELCILVWIMIFF